MPTSGETLSALALIEAFLEGTTFNTFEVSNQNGVPVGLYIFEWGPTTWRYTSADQDIIWEGDTFKSIAIQDDGVVQGGSSSNDMTIHCQADLPVVDLFRSTPPADSIWLTVRRFHEEDNAAVIYWKGTIANCRKVAGGAEAVIAGQALSASFNRDGLRLCWTKGCQHMLYDSGCRVNRDDFKVIAEVTSKTGTSITVDDSGHPVGWYDGGFVEWTATDEGMVDRRGIELSISGNELQLFGLTDRVEVGMMVSLFAGCARDGATCLNKFSNHDNYGGFEQMTEKSLYDGTRNF